MSANHLNTVFAALVILRLLCALPAWGMFVYAAKLMLFCKKNIVILICLLTLLKHCLVKFRHPTTVYMHFFLKKILNYTLRNSDTSYTLPQ